MTCYYVLSIFKIIIFHNLAASCNISYHTKDDIAAACLEINGVCPRSLFNLFESGDDIITVNFY